MPLSPVNLLASVVAALPAHFSRFDRLGIDADGTGIGLAAGGPSQSQVLPQGVDDFLPGAVSRYLEKSS